MSTDRSTINTIINTRKQLQPTFDYDLVLAREQAAEGGCGVIGIASSEQIAGKHLLQALDQMRNRGNGKGGGIAAVGLLADEFGVSKEIIDNDYLLVIAYLEPEYRKEVESKYIFPIFDIDHIREAPHLNDYQELPRLEVRPPDVVQYFVRVKDSIYQEFVDKYPTGLTRRQIEDEIVYQNTFRLNYEFYSSTGETRAFVLSHGKNLLVLKMVGYGDDVVRYYQLENIHAHVWIGHHRYPTKGRVWHPGGAHPFVGLNEALVHNGDFANYSAIAEYLAQRNIFPLFLTDTEVSVQVFDLLYRTYDYPLEYVIEALAPTTERDFNLLPQDKQKVYQLLQVTHVHSSPDGPWFFLIAQSDLKDGEPVYRLTGITDTSMLRPQVFALQQVGDDGPAIGFAASEKQGIDAALASLAKEDKRFWPHADRFWNARGGSHTDGGAFMFSIYPSNSKPARLVCTDKFGHRIQVNTTQRPYQPYQDNYLEADSHIQANLFFKGKSAQQVFEQVLLHMPTWEYQDVKSLLHELENQTQNDAGRSFALETLAYLIDKRYPTGSKRRSSLLSLYFESLNKVVELISQSPSDGYVFSGYHQRHYLPAVGCQTVIVNCSDFQPEGANSAAMEIARLHTLGFRKILVVGAAGHRFIGNGLGSHIQRTRIDVFGSAGDYLASGIDNVEIIVHGSGQDQLAQIMKSGKLVVYGDVGQTFGYAAKGGEAYILGNAAGRPMINAVGKPRIVINGTCLDYLAESFMAGEPHNNGGFVVLNGIILEEDGSVTNLETPYPGSNLFSLASGGAIFVRDPYQQLVAEQLNGGTFTPFTSRDWSLIKPYLQENERLFGIKVEQLLMINGREYTPLEVYRKIRPAKVRALQAEEAWVQIK